MKKVLLGTTALAAVGLLASNVAIADDEMMEGPVTVGVGGYTTGAIGFASDSDSETRSHEISYVYEIGVSGSTTLDNGITVSVSGQLGRSSGTNGTPCNVVEIAADGEGTCGSGTDFDELHATFSGSFGALRLGRTESAAFNTTTAAPGAGIGGMFGVNYPWFSTAGGSVNTYSGLGKEDALKVVYTSPNFNGLTVGLSYAPEDSEGNFTGRMIGAEDKATGHTGLGAHTAVGMTYSTDFMEGGSVSLGAAYETADMEAGSDDPAATRFGINVGVDQLSFGGSMYDVDGGATQYDVGASWTEGSIELGIQYANDDGNASMAAGHLTYTLGPGVLVGAQIAGISEDGADDVTQVMLGTAIFF